LDCAEILKNDKILHADQIMKMINSGDYEEVKNLLSKE